MIFGLLTGTSATLIAVAFFQPLPIPVDLSGICRWAISFVPLAPMLGWLVSRLGWTLSARIVVPTLVAAFATGVVLTALQIAFGPGSSMNVLHTVLLTFVMIAGLSLATNGRAVGIWSVAFCLALVLSTLAAFWTIGSAVAIAWQSGNLADGHPFCLATASGREPTSLRQFRPFDFYNTRSGYKDRSDAHFNLVLFVDHDDGTRLYNWTFRNNRFEPIAAPERFLPGTFGTCVPAFDYWQSRPVL